MKKTGGAKVILSSTNQNRAQAKNRMIHRNRKRTKLNPHQVAKRANWRNLCQTFQSWTSRTMISAKRLYTKFKINHVIKKHHKKTKSTEAEQNFEKAEFIFMTDLKTLIHKTSVDPKLLQLKICVRNKHKERALEEFSLVFSEITERFGLLFAEDRIVVPEELKRPVLDALRFRQPGSTKMVAKVAFSSGVEWKKI